MTGQRAWPLLLALFAPAAEAELRFVNAAAEAGLRTATWCGRQEKPHLLESGGTGLALFDADGDGDLDLYLVNGWRLQGAQVVERGRDLFYRNLGDGTFAEATVTAGLGDDSWGAGVAVGDADGDQWPDLFVSNFGPDSLYRNRGDGTFERVPEAPGIDGWSTGAAFFDADGDGDEDLFVSGYVDCTLPEVLAERPRLDWQGQKVMLGPFGLEGLANRYFENLGAGRFREATKQAGLVDVGLYYSFGVGAADLDGDSDLDLYVSNDSNPNYLYRNDGTGHFEEMGLWSGAALDGAGNAQAGMGVAVADLDQDGLLDLFVTNFWHDASTLYHNLGEMVFEDVTADAGLLQPTFQPLSWGTALVDLDLDGDLDALVANGHIYPQADAAPAAKTSFRQRNLVLVNEGGRFLDGSASAGSGLQVLESSRGLAVGDLDLDGDLDIMVANVDAPPSLLRNDSDRSGAWLLVDAPGSRVVTAGLAGRHFVRHQVNGGSYLSASDCRHHFGLGPATRVERLEILWAGAGRQLFRDLPADRVLVLRGQGAPEPAGPSR